jgi:hypothetical protein
MGGRPANHNVTEGDRLLGCSPGQHAVNRSEGYEQVFVVGGFKGGMVSGNGSQNVFIVDFNSPAEGEEDSPWVAILQKSLRDTVVIQDAARRLRFLGFKHRFSWDVMGFSR